MIYIKLDFGWIKTASEIYTETHPIILDARYMKYNMLSGNEQLQSLQVAVRAFRNQGVALAENPKVSFNSPVYP